jgi:hypothetical protein
VHNWIVQSQAASLWNVRNEKRRSVPNPHSSARKAATQASSLRMQTLEAVLRSEQNVACPSLGMSLN